jgi:hypothetical protein
MTTKARIFPFDGVDLVNMAIQFLTGERNRERAIHERAMLYTAPVNELRQAVAMLERENYLLAVENSRLIYGKDALDDIDDEENRGQE